MRKKACQKGAEEGTRGKKNEGGNKEPNKAAEGSEKRVVRRGIPPENLKHIKTVISLCPFVMVNFTC